MWSGHYFQIEGRWTPSMGKLPRWMPGNSYPGLGDFRLTPALGSIGTTAVTLPSGSALPASWAHTTVAPASGFGVLESILDATTSEFDYAHTVLSALGESHSLGLGKSEPDFMWTLQLKEDAQTVEVAVAGGTWLTIYEAKDVQALFLSGERCWRQEEGQLYVYGLDLYESTTLKTDGWHYLRSNRAADLDFPIHWRHPKTAEWLPLPPTALRSDGLVGIYYDTASISVRTHAVSGAACLPQVNLRVNGEAQTARRVSLTNSLDHAGALVGINRLDSEGNSSYAAVLERAVQYGSGQSRSDVVCFLSAALRTSNVSTVASGATTVSITAGTTAFNFSDGRSSIFFAEEVGLLPDSQHTGWFRSLFASPEAQIAYVGPHVYSLTSSGSLFHPQTDTSLSDRVDALWLLRQWTESGDLTLSENFDHPMEGLEILKASKVDASMGTSAALARSFAPGSPLVSWSLADIGDVERIFDEQAIFD